MPHIAIKLSELVRKVITQANKESPLAAAMSFSRNDREFLPASIELLVTPPSPVATALMLTICGAFLTALVWAYCGSLDIYAVTPGKVQPSGRSKIVQPLEPGRVVAIHVDNGAIVHAGDVLLELDSTESGADRMTQLRELEAASAEASRRAIAIKVARADDMKFASQPIDFDPRVDPSIRDSEASALKADLTQLRATLASLTAQLEEKRASQARLNLEIDVRKTLVALAQERIHMRQEIKDHGAGSRAQIIEAEQTLQTLLVTDATDRGQVLEIDASLKSVERKQDEAVSNFIAEQTNKQIEADRKRAHLEQDVIKAQSKNDRTQLRAPISGTVQQLVVTNTGQVVSSGQALLTVVPLDGPIEVEALIANQDIGFVKLGQSAVIKVDAFPFTRYGTIEAEVVKISRDGVDQSATNTTDPSAGGRGAAPAGGRPQILVFPATLKLAHSSMMVDGTLVGLTAGMSVTAEIKTGSRRAIDYVLSPLREMTGQAAHER